MLRLFLLSLAIVPVFGQQPTTTSPPPSKAELKRQKQAKEKASREAANHFTVALAGAVVGCLTLSDMAFHRDIIRGWGGLLGGGRNAFLGVSSTLTGIVKNTCAGESPASITANFYDTSGLLLGWGVIQVLVPASESRSFQVPWSCSHGADYLGGNGQVWIPNCPADTARYRATYQ